MATKRFNNEYDQQAADFCEKYGVVIEKKFVRIVKGFPNDENDKYEHEKFSIKVYKKSTPEIYMEFDFFGSYHDYAEYIQSKNLGRPRHKLSDYSILACLSGDSYAPDTIEEFIDEYGYEIKRGGDLSRVTNIFNAVKKQNDDLRRVFSEEEIEALREIN